MNQAGLQDDAATWVSYPVHLDLRGRRVLVIGAGRVATRKIERLIETGARVHVVATEASAIVQRLARDGALTLSLRHAAEDDAADAMLVLCATGDTEVNARLAAAGRAAGALVSRVDAPEASDFTVPGRARGQVVDATVSTGGSAPSASRRLTRELRAWLAAGPDRFADEVARARRALQGRSDAHELLRKLSDSSLYEACANGDDTVIEALVRDITGVRP